MKESGLSDEASDVTILPEPSDLTVTKVDGNNVSMKAADNADHKDGYRTYIGKDGYLEFPSAQDTVFDFGYDSRWKSDPISFVSKISANTQSDDIRWGSWGYSYSDNAGILLRYNSGTIQVLVGDGADIQYLFRVNYDLTGGPHIVAVRVEDGNHSLYVNGPNIATDTTALTINWTGSSEIDIGEDSSGYSWYGNMHRHLAYDRALSDAELADASSGSPPSDSRVFDAMFNEGSGDEVTDFITGKVGGMAGSTPTWHKGGAMSQDGGDLDPRYSLDLQEDVVPFSTKPVMDPTGSTALFEFKMDAVNSGIVGNVSGGAMSMIELDNENIRCETDENGNFFRPDPNPVIAAGEKHVVVVRFDAREADWYIDGTYYDVTDYGTNYSTDESRTELDGPLTSDALGGYSYMNRMDGQFNRASWYDRPLTDGEIESWADGGLPDSPLHHFPLNGSAEDDYITDSTSGETSTFDNPDGTSWAAPLRPITYTTTSLQDGTDYVARMSTFTEHTESFDS